MGDYLRNAYALKGINDLIDAEKKKLYDRLDDLTLSHNRKVRALNRLWRIFKDFQNDSRAVTFETDGKAWNEMIKICEDALFSNGRERCRIKSPMRKKGTASS